MLWWFLILAASFGVVLWAGIAMYVRVRQHMFGADSAQRLNNEDDTETGVR